MFTTQAFRAFQNDIMVGVAGMNRDAAVSAMVMEAEKAKSRVFREQTARDGLPPAYRQIVDGVEGAPLPTVKPDGVIVLAWQYLAAIVQDTYEILVARSPQDTGDYIAGLIILVDGHEAGVETIDANTREVHIVASVPYARRLEVGKRKGGGAFVLEVKSHIVEETAIVARRLAGDLASFKLKYVRLSDAYDRSRMSGPPRRAGRVPTDVRYPAILITPRTA